jgi:tetratricopeptide (TPR) repeat protein
MRPIVRVVALGGCLLLFGGCGGGADEPPAPDAEPASTETAPAQAPAAGGPQLPPLQDLAAAVQRNPADAQTRHLYAIALHREGRREEAIAEFEKAAELNPEPMMLIELGNAYASVERMEDSQAAFLRALEAKPGHSVALYHLGNLARRRGDSAEAISLYRQSIENDPQNLLAHFQLAEALRQAGELEEAYRSYEEVVGLDPRYPPEVAAFDGALFHLANLDLQMGATERAVQFLEILTQNTPNHPTAHLLLSQALSKLGRTEEAQRALETHQRLGAAQR